MAAPLRYGDWAAEVARSGPSPATLLCGPESWLRDSALALIKTRLFGDESSARLGHDRFYGGEGPLAAVTTALAEVGLFTGRRLVTLSAFEKFGRAGAADRRELTERVKRGTPGSFFVGLSELSPRELERKNEFARALLGVAQVVELAHPTAAEAMRWLLGECRRRGLALEAEAGEYLLSRTGPDLQELSRELEKLQLATEPGDRIPRSRIEEMIQRGELGTAWQLCEAVLAGRVADSVRLWSAVRRCEPVLRAQWLLQQQARGRLAQSAGAAQTERLRRVLFGVYELEHSIKTGRVPSGLDETAMELLVAAG